MPKIEMMLVDYGDFVSEDRVFNLDASVGRGAPNKPGDVMLVQAMFQAIHKAGAHYYFMGRRTSNDARLSEPTGKADHQTLTAIWNMQTWMASLLLAIDGRIDPASFTDRKLRLRAKKKVMLQLLNQELSVYSNMKGAGSDHTLWLMNMYPQLRAHVRDITAKGNVTTVA